MKKEVLIAVAITMGWVENNDAKEAFLNLFGAVEAHHAAEDGTSKPWTLESVIGALQDYPPRSCPHCSCLVALSVQCMGLNFPSDLGSSRLGW